MARKEVESSFAEAWEPKTSGEELIGIFKGVEKIPAPNKPGETFSSYRIRVTEGEHEGKAMGFSGSFASSKMSRIPRGEKVYVTFLGLDMDKKKKGFNAPKMFKVEVDDGVKLIDDPEPEGVED